MACPCYNGGPNCILSANVCEGYFVIISPPISALNITEQGNYGTATLYENYVVYEHNGNSLVTDTFRYLNSDNEVCEVTVTIEDTIPVETEVKIFTAYGECEVGNVTYKWTLPEGVTLVDGYTIYDQTIHVIVPLFDINNPTIQYDFIVDVCCDYCNNCCKCDTITYLPPICTTECGEDEECYCPYDCTEYNPETGNCEPTCSSDEICCTLVTTGETEIAYSIDYEWDCFSIYDRDNLEYFEVSVTATTNGSNLTFYLPDIDNLNPPTSTCLSLAEQEQLDISEGSYIINENRGYFIEDNVIKLVITNCSGDCLNSVFWLYVGMTAETPCGLIENNVLLSPLFYEGSVPVDWYAVSACEYFAEYTDTDPVALCNVSSLCTVSSNTETNYCAECCDDGDCIPNPGCFNDNLFCQYGECFCVVGNELIPQPDDGSCCPQCTEETTLPPCHLCTDGLIISPNTSCPPNYIWDWNTCLCQPDPCLENQCIVPIGDMYCPEITDCGCIDNNCVTCSSVTCITTNDCPFGCYCDENEQICLNNPCAVYNCVTESASDYCPRVVNCGCDEEDCVPCDAFPCETTDDCPFGCTCVSGTCNGPCGQLQLDCDAYIVHNENDLTLNYSYNGSSFTITANLALEPDFVFTNGNTTWEINLSNYTDGWYEVTGQLVIDGNVAAQVINGNLVFYTQYFTTQYVMIQLEVAGRKVWYRLEFISGGVDYNNENFEIGGVYLCRKIFTIESLTGINWEATEWIVSNPDIVLYESETTLVIDCPVSTQFEGEVITIIANVINPINDCEINTCNFEYECECFGNKECENYITDIHSNYNQSTGIWDIAIDVLYDNGEFNEIVFLDCEFLNSLQLPIPWNCENCGTIPYNSQLYPNGNLDDSVNDIQICFNPTANNNCNCVCGYTFYGAYVIEYNGAWIKLQVTDPLNAGFCYQADIAGNFEGEPCCINYCEILEFEPICSMIIDADISCISVTQFAINILVNGNNGAIVNIKVNDVSTPFNTEDDETYTILVSGLPNSSITITVIDIYGCEASQVVSLPCCDINYNISPIYCEGIECQPCSQSNPNIIVGYTITIENEGLDYTLILNTNDIAIGNNGELNTGLINVTEYVLNLQSSILEMNCEDLLINSISIGINECITYATGECLYENCYNGLWTSVGHNITQWNSPLGNSYINYKFTGLNVNGTVYSFGANPIDLKAIICEAHRDALNSSCLDEPVILGLCASGMVNLAAQCYNNPSSCITNALPSNQLKTYHQLVADKLLISWNCRLNSYLANSNILYLDAINMQLSALGYPNLGLMSYTQTSNLFAPTLLPDNTNPGQIDVFRYMVITDEKYPSGLIRPIRNTILLPNTPLITTGCENDLCQEYGYNCEACNAFVLNGEYQTTGECVTECESPCENIYEDIIPSVVSFTPAEVLDVVFNEPSNIDGIINNAIPVSGCYFEYGTMKVKFNFPSIPACTEFTRIIFNIVGNPNAEGWINSLDVGTDYAPLYTNPTANGVQTYHGSAPSINLPVSMEGSSLGNEYEIDAPATVSPVSGTFTTILDINLNGVTTNPLTWELHLVGFGGADSEELPCDILNSISATLYTSCNDCDGIIFYTCEDGCLEPHDEGDYTSYEDCIEICEALCEAEVLEMEIINVSGDVEEGFNYEYAPLDIDDYYDMPVEMMSFSNNVNNVDTSIFSLNMDDVSEQLNHVTNMYNFGIGTKITNGIDTGEPSIIVFVDIKQEVSKNIEVPQYINGYKTDVQEGENIIKAYIEYCVGDCYEDNYSQTTSCSPSSVCWVCINGTDENCLNWLQVNCDNNQVGCSGEGNNCVNNGSYLDFNNCIAVDNRNNSISSYGANFGKLRMIGGLSGFRQSTGACTFGMVVIDNETERLAGICNSHCFKCTHYNTDINGLAGYITNNYEQVSSVDKINNPSLIKSVVGTFNRDVEVVTGTTNNIDVAMIDLLLPNDNINYVIPKTDVFNIGEGPYEWMTEDEVNTAVLGKWAILKSGRTTGLVGLDTLYIDNGVVSGQFKIDSKSVSISVQGCYCSETSFNESECEGIIPQFYDVIKIKNDCNNRNYVGAPGDSSSPILAVNPNDGKIKFLGLLFAGSCDAIYVIPAYNIEDRLNVSYWNGNIVLNANYGNTVTVDGKNYVYVGTTNKEITHIKD